jgi:hypothetical protein
VYSRLQPGRRLGHPIHLLVSQFDVDDGGVGREVLAAVGLRDRDPVVLLKEPAKGDRSGRFVVAAPIAENGSSSRTPPRGTRLSVVRASSVVWQYVSSSDWSLAGLYST